MAERPEDLNLPNAVVTRIIKDAIPDGVNVSKEARLAISKAASVFVLYATSCSNNFALKNKRKTINAQDVMSAMEDMEFEQFIEPLLQCQEAFLHDKKEKKKEKIIRNLPAIQQPSIEEANEVEEVSDEEDGEGESSGSKDSSKDKDKEVPDMELVSKEVEERGSSPEVMEDTGE